MLHIHNGDSTAGTMTELGFPGEHLAFNEVLMSGPTPRDLSSDNWRNVRATFLADEYELNLEDCQRNLLQQESKLRRFSEHDEAIVWFEHDLFCQINLIYLLDWFSKQPRGRTRLSLICIGEFPGIEDFRGLGELTGERLASLFDSRHEVSGSEFRIASRAWAAYCSTNPEEIARLLDGDTSAMPFLGNALRLHLSRFPSVKNGLGQVEQKTLELISDGAREFASLFLKFAKANPVYGLGDVQFWNELKRLANVREPLIEVSQLVEVNQFGAASFELTGTGRSVLTGERDFVEINGIDLWLGGVHLFDADSLWRWDEGKEQLTRGIA